MPNNQNNRGRSSCFIFQDWIPAHKVRGRLLKYGMAAWIVGGAEIVTVMMISYNLFMIRIIYLHDRKSSVPPGGKLWTKKFSSWTYGSCRLRCGM